MTHIICRYIDDYRPINIHRTVLNLLTLNNTIECIWSSNQLSVENYYSCTLNSQRCILIDDENEINGRKTPQIMAIKYNSITKSELRT